MHTKNGRVRKQFWLFVALLGTAVLLGATMYFIWSDKMTAQEKLRETVSYVKVQCATYTKYNEASESLALLRAIESVKQTADRLADAEEAPSQSLLKECARKSWLNGIILLDADGNELVCYHKNENVADTLAGYLEKDAILDAALYEERVYAQRIHFDDGAYLDMAACRRQGRGGIIVSYYYTSARYARNYALTLQSLLSGYRTAEDGTVIIADEGVITASNDTSLIGQKTADNAVIQAIKANGDSRHIVHVRDSRCSGIMLKQRDYYIYAYIPDTTTFRTLPQSIFIVVMGYLIFVLISVGLQQRSEFQYEEEYRRLESEKDEKYRQELIDARKKAEAANVTKTQFLQRMSHDIRTPINGICGMIDVADYYADDLDKQTECRTKIREASHLLLELVNEVLDMGKLESGEMVLDERVFDLQESIEEVIVVIEKLAAEQGLTVIRGEMKVTHRFLIGSPGHVKRLLMNILSNSVKYNRPNGTITIACEELESENPDRAVIRFVCSDTGIGMSREYQEKIFEPFTQENKKISSKYGGTGLGMPITKGLVEKMGGTLTFESTLNVGTTFVVTLPFVISGKGETKKESGDTKATLEGRHILLVEDNELNMEIAEFVLKNAGAKVQKAWNGKEAVQAFEVSKPGELDVILMDLMMPEMDGYQATACIRGMEREDARTIPIIAMTANAFAEDRIRTRKAGMNEHIAKPLNVKSAVETIARVAAENAI